MFVSVFFFLLSLVIAAQAESLYQIETSLPFKKVIIWGHKPLHSHTHSYIHEAFYKAFKSLGYETYWLDQHDDTRNIDFSNALFITEGQVDRHIPIRLDCLYIIHNCDGGKYQRVINKNRCITLQVYTHDVLPRKVVKEDDCIYYSVEDKTIYMPWATDLLPHEIDEIKKHIPTRTTRNTFSWIGTYCDGEFGNINEIQAFRRACYDNRIEFQHIRHCSMEENIKLIQESYMAPALQGPWQCRQGYIPCRIFKNISYGQFGITNSKTVYDLFKGKIIYNPDSHQLFYDAKKKLDTLDINELYELMDFVKNKHTYLNRIETLLRFFEMVYYNNRSKKIQGFLEAK